jgi:hypothetical protein
VTCSVSAASWSNKLRETGLIGASGRRRKEPIGLALEQRHGKPRLEQMHHPADRGGGHVQLVCSLSKAAAARGGLEGLDAVHEGKLAHSTIRKTEPDAQDNSVCLGRPTGSSRLRERIVMSLILTAVVLATMVATCLPLRHFGMAGGLILIGVLLVIMPVPEAMMLHGVTQMASNGWRGLLWVKHVRWSAIGAYLAGCAAALLLWSLWRYVPSKAVALLLLGGAPFLVRLVPARFKPDPESIVQGSIYGVICMTLLLLTGVSGPLLDSFFLGGKLDRREIIATKAVCQIFGHAAKASLLRRRDRSGRNGRPGGRGAGDRGLDARHDARGKSAGADQRRPVPRVVEPDHHRRVGLFRRLWLLRFRCCRIKVSAEAVMTEATNLDPLVLDLRRMDRQGAACLCRRARCVANFVSAPHRLGRCDRSRAGDAKAGRRRASHARGSDRSRRAVF